MGKTFGKYAEDIRDPIIEAITAITLMVWLYFIYPSVSFWLIISSATIVLVIAVAVGLLIILVKEANKLKIENNE